jgi:hypothetical protein
MPRMARLNGPCGAPRGSRANVAQLPIGIHIAATDGSQVLRPLATRARFD